MNTAVYFWHLTVSPHMTDLTRALAALNIPTHIIAAQMSSPWRRHQGWASPDPGAAKVTIVDDSTEAKRIALASSENSVHICQGIRGNGYISSVQACLRRRQLTQLVLLETVDDAGILRVPKRLVYRRLLSSYGAALSGVLAIGHSVPSWLAEIGFPESKVFPFAYFLPSRIHQTNTYPRSLRFRFLYVGRLVRLKRVDLMLMALHKIRHYDYELHIIGSGPLQAKLERLANRLIPNRVTWHGSVSMHNVPMHMNAADCLVLPSRYDGWGATVSEAMLAGTPAICSNACGVAETVECSNVGGVFPANDCQRLSVELANAITRGRWPTDRRLQLAEWAEKFSSTTGARYLWEIISYIKGGTQRPNAPWRT